MMIYLVVAVIFLHFSVFPVTVSVAVKADTDKKFGTVAIKLFFIPVFKKRFDSERLKAEIKAYAEGKENKEENNKSGNKSDGGGAFLTGFVKHLSARVRVRLFDVNVRLGSGNAALDAVAVGALRILYDQACAFLNYDGRGSEIEPYFDGVLLFLECDGIFSLCIADIIYAFTRACFACTAGKKRRNKNADTVTE